MSYNEDKNIKAPLARYLMFLILPSWNDSVNNQQQRAFKKD